MALRSILNEIKDLDWFVVIFTHEKSQITPQIEEIIPGILHEFKDYDEDIFHAYDGLQQKQGSFQIISNQYYGDPSDPDDVTGNTVRNLFPDARIFHFGYEYQEAFYRIIFVFRASRKGGYWRGDVEFPQIRFDSLAEEFEAQDTINHATDIRKLLAGIGFSRKITLVAGSPGWETNDKQKLSATRNRNEGKLDAAQNDFNAIFDILQGLTIDDKFRGISCIGLVTEKKALLSLLKNCLASEKQKINPRQILTSTPGFNGIIIQDSTLSGGFIMESVTAIDSVFGVPENDNLILHPNERLIDKSQFVENKGGSPVLPYALIYYGGHGDKNGHIQIEQSENISPLELFQISIEYQIPFAIILDMCYAHLFGEKYQELLIKHNWTGLVIASNDGKENRVLSYESGDMAKVSRPKKINHILEPSDLESRGVLTTAISLGMKLLREHEIEHGLNHSKVSIRRFVEELLIPITDWLHRSFGVPLQKPAVYSHQTLLADSMKCEAIEKLLIQRSISPDIVAIQEMTSENIDRIFSMHQTLEIADEIINQNTSEKELALTSDESLLAAKQFCKYDEDRVLQFDVLEQEELRRKLKTPEASKYCDSGYTYLTKGDFDLAEDAFRKAIELSPKLINAYSNLGGLLTDTGRPHEARKLLEDGLAKVGLTCLHAYNLGECYRVLGHFNESLLMLRMAIALGIWDFDIAAKMDTVERALAGGAIQMFKYADVCSLLVTKNVVEWSPGVDPKFHHLSEAGRRAHLSKLRNAIEELSLPGCKRILVIGQGVRSENADGIFLQRLDDGGGEGNYATDEHLNAYLEDYLTNSYRTAYYAASTGELVSERQKLMDDASPLLIICTPEYEQVVLNYLQNCGTTPNMVGSSAVKAELMHALPYTSFSESAEGNVFSGVQGARLISAYGNTSIRLALQFFVTEPKTKNDLWLKTRVSLLLGDPIMEELTHLVVPDNAGAQRYREGEIWGCILTLSIPAKMEGFYRIEFFIAESNRAPFTQCHGTTLIHIGPE